MTSAQKRKDKKDKISEGCNKKELTMITFIFLIIIIRRITIYNNNDSNRKGKSLKVATKKTLKIKEFLFPDF